MDNIKEIGKVIKAISEREKHKQEVDAERKKGLNKGEHYYTIYRGLFGRRKKMAGKHKSKKRRRGNGICKK
jgi:hypothetical protein